MTHREVNPLARCNARLLEFCRATGMDCLGWVRLKRKHKGMTVYRHRSGREFAAVSMRAKR